MQEVNENLEENENEETNQGFINGYVIPEIKKNIHATISNAIKTMIDFTKDRISDKIKYSYIYETDYCREDEYVMMYLTYKFPKTMKRIGRRMDKNVTYKGISIYTVSITREVYIYDKSTKTIIRIRKVKPNPEQKYQNNTARELSFIGPNAKKVYIEFLQIKEDITKSLNNKNELTVCVREGMKQIWLYPPFKKMDNIAISPTIKRKLISTLDSWMQLKEACAEIGEFHKLGILLSGPAGTGKSTLIRSIAEYTSSSIILVRGGMFNKYSSEVLSQIIDTVGNRMVVFEDFDYLFSGDKTKLDPERAADVRALMEMLDGQYSTNETIYVLTANNVETIYKDVIRPGRIDLSLYIGDINKEEAHIMMKSYGLSENNMKYLDARLNYPINPSRLRDILVPLWSKKVLH